MTPGERTGVGFRMASEARAPSLSTTELEEHLQQRLRLLAVITTSALGLLGALGAYLHRENIRADLARFWTEPPLPGVLLIVAMAAVIPAVALSPRRQFAMGRLRAIEWAGVSLIASFFVANQVASLRDLLAAGITSPMELGIAHGAPWGILILAFAALIPSNAGHAVRRTGAVTAMAFIPDLVTFASTANHVAGWTSLVALKAFVILLMGALAIYGSYRVEQLGQEAALARELGQYLLGRQIGEGGMGNVYLAEHRFLKRPCAVKLIRPEQATDSTALARFEREVQSAASLTHPNTVQIYDYGRSEDGTFYFAMEFLPGQTLDEVVEREGPMAPARAVHILAQLCGALSEAHQMGLVHRDIKPGNVMLCERGGVPDVAKLLDYGLVAAAQSQPIDERITQAGLVIGTPAFMSPEQCMGEPEITPASDIYSLGAVGYFLLSGSPPFQGLNVMQTIALHLTEPARPLREVRPEISADLSIAVAKCLEKEPANRYASVMALARDLETV